jgi:energy-coupling factor transporter transmembrane protein EcfT
MDAFLQKLQDSDFGVWVSSAPTLLAYPTILMLHTVGLALVVGPIAVLSLRLLGVGARMPISIFRNVFAIMWWGFLLNAATGIALFISEAAEKGEQVDFYVKLTLIALALFTATRMKRLVFAGRDDTTVDRAVPPKARSLAVASLLLWAGAITAGRLMAYLK